MTTVKDRFDREWELDIAVPEIKAVRQALEINLWDAFAAEWQVYHAVIENPETLVAVCHVICRKQIREQNISDDSFGQGWKGESLRALGEAFTQELTDFFPNTVGRDLVRATVTKARAVLDMRDRMRVQAVEELDEASLLASTKRTSINSAGSAESTPAGSASAKLP